MSVLLATFAVAIASALIPLINIEGYIAGVNVLTDPVNIWVLSTAAAAGQAVGKVFWYEVGRNALRWPYVRRKMEKPGWRKQYDRAKRLTDERPLAGAGLLALSAVAGFPPLAVMAVLAGHLRFHRLWFYAITFAGRLLRFAAVLAGVAWLSAFFT